MPYTLGLLLSYFTKALKKSLTVGIASSGSPQIASIFALEDEDHAFKFICAIFVVENEADRA